MMVNSKYKKLPLGAAKSTGFAFYLYYQLIPVYIVQQQQILVKYDNKGAGNKQSVSLNVFYL